ncbi:hypothetical protein H5410_052158 [Solanum commersonii]|uniref:Uncharacterized protein n=1 Tax=Solanum commersonii TaxID=4109 RepID=A0A9J5X0D6_SOLCO|nr:hypothetical protein H5410_052158 [Solanum commersonii]
MNFFSTLTLSKLPPMTKVVVVVSSIPPTISTSNDLYNDRIPSSPLLPLGTYIDVELDVRVETTTPNKADVPNEGKLFDVTRSKLQIKKKITPMHRVNLDRPKWRESKEKKYRYYFELVSGSKFRPKYEVGHFLKIGRKRAKFNFIRDVATPCEGKIEEEWLEIGKNERTYIGVVLDVRVENITLYKGDVPNEGKVSDVTLSKLQIQRKIKHMRPPPQELLKDNILSRCPGVNLGKEMRWIIS